jgi:prephenate dehydratase
MQTAAQLRAARAAPAPAPAPHHAARAAPPPASPLSAPAPQVACRATLRSRRSAPRAVAAAAAAGTKDRGEWTRFLEWSADDARASVDCELLSGGAAAEVTVVAPDRPGLLSDITATIASLGLNIERVRARAVRAAARAASRPASRAT